MRRRNLAHRSVGVVVIDGRGQVLIHRRSDDKDVWPGRWDLAAGGVLSTGETSESAARRELSEELGIEPVELRHLTDGHFTDDLVTTFATIFVTTWDGPVRFRDGEVAEAVWVTAAGLRARLATDRFVPDSVALISPYLDRLAQ